MKQPVKIFGISLLELMLSLAVIAVLLLAATRYFQSTRSAQETNEAVKMVQTLTNAADNWFWTFKTYQGTPPISITALVGRSLIPQDFKVPDEDAGRNPWGGNVEVTPLSATQIEIKFSEVPAADCLNLRDIVVKQGFDANCSTESPSEFVVQYPKQ